MSEREAEVTLADVKEVARVTPDRRHVQFFPVTVTVEQAAKVCATLLDDLLNGGP